MNVRSFLFFAFFALTLLVGLSSSRDSAAAEPGDSRGIAAGARSRAALDHEFETAMLHMDHKLTALLGSRTMDCDGEDAAGGLETCWVSLELTRAVEAPTGPVHH